MASQEFENASTYIKTFANAWPNDFELIELLRKFQTQFCRQQSPGVGTDVLNEATRSLRKIILEKSPDTTNRDSQRNKLRKLALNILASDNAKLAFSDTQSFQAIPLEFFHKVLREDNDQNAEIALNILSLPAFTSRAITPLSEITQSLVEYCKGIISGMHDVFTTVCRENTLFLQQSSNPSLDDLDLSKTSKIRFIPIICKLSISRYEAGDSQILRGVAEVSWIELNNFPIEKFLHAVKNTRVYKEYLTKTVGELLALLELARQQHQTPIEISSGMMANIQLRIIQNLPPGTESLRLSILKEILKSLDADPNRPFQGIGGIPVDNSAGIDRIRSQNMLGVQIDAATPLIDVLGTYHLECLIDSGKMQGRGRPQAEIQLTHAALFRALGQRKVPFTPSQIQRVVRIICKSFLDNAVPLSQKSTLIYYLHGLNVEYGRKRDKIPRVVQYEILSNLVDLCKILRPHLESTIKMVRQHELNKKEHLEQEQQKQDNEVKFDLAEKSLLQASKPSSQNNIQTGLILNDKEFDCNNRIQDISEAQRVAYSKVMWNCIASADLIFTISREQRQQLEGGSGTFLEPNELKIVKRLLLNGSEIIQGISELGPSNEGGRTVRFFADFFRRIRPLQLKDILNDVGPQLFARVVVAKTQQYLRITQKNAASGNQNNQQNSSQQEDQGVVSLVLGDFASFTANKQAMEDEHVCAFLECAFDFVSNRLTKLSAPEIPGPAPINEEPIEIELAALPKAELQEALVDLALLVGEQALKRPNEIRTKHIFFSVFVFCVKQAKNGALVADHYYVIIIRLFRDLCTAEHEGLVKEFLPMIQGLLETFLQSRDSVPYIEVTNHIFECVPAKLKSLLDYLPVISKPVVESMRTVAHRDLERPLNTLQLWVSGLGQFPEILDPAISHVLPELTGMLYKILYQLPNFPFKLLGKLGAKSRPYWQDQEVSTRRFSEGGLKLRLKDRHSEKEIVLGIDAAIEVVLVKIFENPRAYSLNRLFDAFKLVKAALLCYIDSDIDVEYLIARVVAAKSQGPQQVEQEILQAARTFDSSRRHNHGSFLARGSEAHAFEKILRSLLFACSLPEDNPDTLKVGKKVLKFMKWVTQYFTLVYVCKDGQLQQSREDEVNPLKFLETISAFLLYNLRPGTCGPQQSSYFEGTVVCLETMLKLLNELFGDTPEVLSNLEIVGILIKKICHLAYEPDIRKRLAVTFALPTVIRELPAQAIRSHSEHILDSLSQILHNGCELSVPAAQREYENTLELLFSKIGFFDPEGIRFEEDNQLFAILIGKVFKNLYSLKSTAREIAASLIEKIAGRAQISVAALTERVFLKSKQGSQISWRANMWKEIESEANTLLPLYRGGFTKLQKLIAYIDCLRFCLRHRIAIGQIESKVHTLLGISELLLKILEIEAHEFDESNRRTEPDTSLRRTPGVETPSSCAQKYMRLERLYISQNQDYDPYSHTQHPHELLSTQHFEVSYQAKREKEKRTDEALTQCSFRILDIFEREGSFDLLNPAASEILAEAEKTKQKGDVETRSAAFLNEIFGGPGMGQRPSDINYDYVGSLYMLYPNVQLHTELICRCLEVLCDIVTHPGLDHYLQERQQAYYAPSQNQDPLPQERRPERNERQGSSKLDTKLDFYAVEIKAKIIAIYFKYFQREEENIIGTTKFCLERLLSEAYLPAEALPNRILKEGVRPALNVLSQTTNSPRAFKHLTMLIEVLHGCFNDQLAQHLLVACQKRQSAVLAPYSANDIAGQQPGFRPLDQAQQLGNGVLPGDVDPNSLLEQERKVVAQYNLEKVGSLETAKHIIQILHLLPNARERVLRQIGGMMKFETSATRELESSHVPPPHGQGQNNFELRPLRVKFGVLQSEFREGLAKFFNRNPVDCVVKLSEPQMVPLMLAILKMPESFTARERIARDMDITIRQRFRQPSGSSAPDIVAAEQANSYLAVKLAWILTKFNSNFLCQPQHSDILENLRLRWVGLSELTIESCARQGHETPEAIQIIKSIYRKILKCLLAYCRSDASDKQVLFDLLKGFSYNSIIDLAPLLRFFSEEVPQFPRRRQAGIIEAALTKVEQSRGSHEQRYAMFEFAFMPLILSCLDQKERFDELFTPNTISLFLRTFFGLVHFQQRTSPPVVKWRIIQSHLEGSSSVCYESFYIELLKALSIIFIQAQDRDRLRACFISSNVSQDSYYKQILIFMKEQALKASESLTREWAGYSMSLLCLKVLQFARIPFPDQQPASSLLIHQGFEQEQHEVQELLTEANRCTQQLWPLILRTNQKEMKQLQLVQKTVQNLISFWHQYTMLKNESKEQAIFNFAEVFDRESRDHPSQYDICRMITLNAEILTPFSLHLRHTLCDLIRTYAVPQSLQNCELIIKAAAAVVSWSKIEFEQQPIARDVQFESKMFKMICAHLIQLVQINLLPNVKDFFPKDIEILLSETLNTIRQMLLINPNQILNSTDHVQIEWREKPLVIRLFELNVSYLAVQYGNIQNDFNLLEFVLNTLNHVKSGEPKCVLLAIQIWSGVIQQILKQNNIDQSVFIMLQNKILEFIEFDIETSKSRVFDQQILQADRQDNQRNFDENQNNQQRKWDRQALQEAEEISKMIPHFSVRLADSLDQLAALTFADSPIRKLRLQILDFPFCKKLVGILLRVVGKARRAIVTERPTFTLNDGNSQQQENQEEQNESIFFQDVIDWQKFEPELDHFNKESVMTGLKFLAKRIHSFKDEDAAQILENLQWLPVALAQFRACDYITEEVDELIGILIQEEPDQERRLQAEKQQALVQRLLERLSESQERRSDRKRDTPKKVKLQNKLFESCIASLERQSSMSTDYANKLMEQLLISSRGRSVELKHRLFTVFERCHGQSIYKKLKFFFTAHQSESPARIVNLFVISQLLDFIMMNFRTDEKLGKLPHSAKLHRLSCPHILIERLSLEEHSQKDIQIRQCLSGFAEKQKKYMQLKLSDLLDPLSEVISINPTYHDDKPIADILFTELFWQLWAIFTRQEQLYLGECITKMFMNAIKHSQTLQQLLKPTTTFARTILESIAAITPQIRLPPELLQFMAKQLNLWHVAIPILENHIVINPKNERYVMALGEVYNRLYEEDYLAGLRRSITESEETRTIVTLGQHGRWEAINQLFAQYITFYAEQEGLYAHLDRHQDWPGKYSRQLPRQFLLSRFEASVPPLNGQNQEQDQQSRSQRELIVAKQYADLYEKPVQDQVAQEHFPKDGPNNKVGELDLRVWETLFIESLKILNKWEQVRDIAHLHGNGDPGGAGDQSPGAHEMWIEFFWQKKDWENLGKYRATLQASTSIKYQLYYIYLIIQEHENSRFDDVFKKVIQLAHQEWETQLPNYVDRAQFESLIMFQQVVESSEGGRSMIREARNLGGNERLKELKAAMNIWRERVPHSCESIKTWKEVLENRNFIYEQLCNFIQPQLNSAAAADPQIGRAPGIGIGPGAAQQPNVELLDICWNLVKLASVSRKHGLPSLALYYQDAAEKRLALSPQGPNDSLRYERYKHQLEVLKLELAHNTEDPQGVEYKVQTYYSRLANEQQYEPWQRATFRRVIADYYLDQGKLRNAQEHLMIAISQLNRRDPKLWMSYAKLNETIFEQQRDQQSFINAIKGLLFATTLSLHKSRLIMPRILSLLRQKEHQYQNGITEYIKVNTEHMPTWIWIFWAPQLLVMLQQPERSMENQIGRHLLGKLVAVYPQASYYPLRANFTFCTGQAPGALRELLRRLKVRDPDVLHDIEMIGKEFNENIKPGPEESLCAWLQGLEIGTFFNRHDVYGSVQNFLQRLYENYLDSNSRSASPLLQALAPSYRADFLNEQTRESCILKSLLRLKNLKDFLLYTINSREQSTHLEELSPCLAHFNRRAIEIPGQHVLSESEPLPQRTVFLDRFDAQVQRSGLTQRKIVFKGSNQKSYPFSATPATDYQRICSEERATQLKVLMNMIFQRHKETLRRGIKFCVPSKLIMYLSKLSQDDLTFQEFQETHDFLLQEKGVDPDIALLLQIKWIRQLFENAPQGQARSLSQINPEEIKQLNKAYFDAMVGNSDYNKSETNPRLCKDECFVPSSLLTSYFHRIFYNVDDLFLFKKRFTTYHATNSFFTYSFNQSEFQNLSNMSFCKSTGRLSFNEPRLKNCHRMLQVFNNKTMEEVEAADFDADTKYMPFRLTSNIVDFIGTIGLQGLFAGVITSCSLAISQRTDKLQHFLTLVLKDELSAQPGEDDQDQVAAVNSDYTMFKIKSLSNHSKIIDLPRTQADRLAEEELDESNPNQWTQIGQTHVPSFMMNLSVTKPDMPEEFNKKVFMLMQLALDDSRRRQMLTMWCPWF